MTPRQETASAIACELHKLGATVTTPLPLADDVRGLRFEVLDSHKQQVLEKIGQYCWSVAPAGVGVRFDVRSYSTLPTSVFQLDIPRERQPVSDDRKIAQDTIGREKSPAEVLAVQRHLGLLP